MPILPPGLEDDWFLDDMRPREPAGTEDVWCDSIVAGVALALAVLGALLWLGVA